jgi:protein-L-isoaspartate(D-aspartate) O-methyltransferase
VTARERMVAEQLVARGIRDERVLAAMRAIPREDFVPLGDRAKAYDDQPLPIGHGQTISQPYIVAKMAELAGVRPTDRVLEIGAGGGYASAVISRLAAEVWGVEIVPELAERARATLVRLGVANARIECFDGTFGWREHAPYDVISVAAGAPRVPILMLEQLADGGRLVIPVGPRESQRLVVVTRRGDEFETRHDIPVRFVDLTGRYGWGGGAPPQA